MNEFSLSRRKFPTGVTSLLVVVGISLVFVVMVTGLTALSIRESRQATNTDLSNRALAAAVAANNVGSEILNTYPTIQVPSCIDPTSVSNGPAVSAGDTFNNLVKPLENSSADNKVEIVCRTITSQGTSIEESLKQNELSQIYTYIPDVNMPSSLDLKWGSLSGNPLPAGYQAYSESGFADGTPSALEVDVLSWNSGTLTTPKSTTDVPTGLTSKTKLLMPDSTLCNGTSADGYKCKINLDLASLIGTNTDRVVVQLKPRYSNTGFKISFKNNAGTNFKVQSSRATIDTTAKVGSQYRRVKAYKNLFGESFVGEVVYSNDNICKNLKVNPDTSLISANNCP